LRPSRDAAWSADIATIGLHIWSLETAIEYLQSASRRTDLSEADARAIAQALGALPLALAHAAAALRNLRMVKPQRYLEHLTTHLKNAPHGAEYPRSVFATFNTAIVQAEQQAPGAAAVLCFAASFAPDAIPDELFGDPIRLCSDGLQPLVPGEDALDLRAAAASELRLDEALGALDRLSLLAFEQSAGTYGLHGLVQLAARDLVNDAAAWAEFAVDAARAALDALPAGVETPSASDLARRCAIYLWARGEYGASEQLCTRALAIAQNTLGPDHLDVARALNNLAVLYMELGRFEEAVPLLRRTLLIRELALGPDDPSVARTLNNLAITYMELGRHTEAESVHARALAIREKAFAPNHPEVVFSRTGLGVLYRRQGRYAEAESLLTRVVAIQEQELGPDHPDVALSLMNLADLYADCGRSAEAEQRYGRALAIWERAHELFGPNHPDVAECLNGLARVYRDQGRHVEAQAVLTRALAIREKTLGPDHPLTKATYEALDALRPNK
jgi:tetratricopeptide (TPR) repeat protein